jgi:DNA-binding MarR family transcriptional regulator
MSTEREQAPRVRRVLTAVEAAIMEAVREKPGSTSAEIAGAVDASPAYVEKVVRRLVASGWLAKTERSTTYTVRRRMVIRDVPQRRA